MTLTFREAEMYLDWLDNRPRREPMPRLVLSRQEGEAVTIDGPARITVTAAGRGRVKLLVEAEHSTRVLRDELLPRVRPTEPVRVPAVEECPEGDVWDEWVDEGLGEAG